jgi:hypothetical protein
MKKCATFFLGSATIPDQVHMKMPYFSTYMPLKAELNSVNGK